MASASKIQLDPEDDQITELLTPQTAAPVLGAIQPALGSLGPGTLNQIMKLSGASSAAPPDQTSSILSQLPALTSPDTTDPVAALGKINTINPTDEQIAQVQNDIFKRQNPSKPTSFLGRVGHVLGTIGNVAGDVVDPSAMAIIPGTQLNNDVNIGRDNALLGKLNTQKLAEQEESDRQQQEADRQRQLTDTENLDSRPQWQPVTGFNGPNGEPLEMDKASGHYRFAQGVPGATMTPKEGEKPLGASVPSLNEALQDRYQVLNPGKPLPAQYTLPANATEKDYDRVDKSLAAVETAQGTAEQRKQTEAMREQAEADRQEAHADAIAARGVTQRQTIYKTYEPVMDAAERFNVMAQNYEDAMKTHNQQAMLSLLYNHLGMTASQQKGIRMSQQVIKEAQQSQPWLQGIKAKFDSNGLLTGVTLSPQQMRDMVALAQSRYRENVTSARNKATYLGAKDDGPDRTPNPATMRFYLSKTNGDVQKAKQLAANDGWSVK